MLRKSYHMKMNKKLLELYSDYIISSFGQITATGLSRALSGEITHDKVTRFLTKEELDSKKLAILAPISFLLNSQNFNRKRLR
jgi:hypothetical protein